MGFPKALTEALAAHLLANVSGIAKVYAEWPNKNEDLTYPSISITSAAPKFERCAPYVLALGTLIPDTVRSINKYVVGQYDVTLQLDLWTRYKLERDTFYEKLFTVLQPRRPHGFTLQLSAYHSQWVGFSLNGYQFRDSEDGATREEWRAILSLEATCRAISTETEYIITHEPELLFSTPNNIP